jgi:nicotinate-nucleotide pyrophosphorylase (carboxylating)
MSLIEMEDAIKEIGGRALVEVSGNVNTLNISHIASMGVDIISVGALTHSPDALDISMLFSV